MTGAQHAAARGARAPAAFWISAVGLVALLAAGYWWLPRRALPQSPLQTPAATPPGITLQLRTAGQRLRRAPASDPVYADEHGLTLYVDGAARGPSRGDCSGSCAEAWLPALALPGSTAAGDWALLARPDRTQQWRFRGAPLYRFRQDAEIGDAFGEADDDGAWHAATFHPEAGIALPGEVAIREIPDAGGTGLIDPLGLTLYADSGATGSSTRRCEPGDDCARHWRPLAAPAIAVAVGAFSAVTREDGIVQWAYQGQPLYTFDHDQKAGDARGIGVDPRFSVALLARQFMPKDAVIRRSPELGSILATAAGATLYQRDRINPDESHDLRGDRGSATLGRAYGTATCDADCAKTRPPFLAPADALPSGYWEILTRPEGMRQWAYKGFALYTYAAEKPGEVTGTEAFELAQVGDDAAAELAATGKRASRPPATTAAVDPLLPFGASVAGVGVTALYWHAVVP